MKILYIITGLPTGGAEMMLYKLLSQINQERFEPIVVSLMDRGTLGDRIEALGIPVHTIGMNRGGIPMPVDVWRLVHLVDQLQPDIIQGWMYHGNLAAQFASFLNGNKIPIVWSIHYSIDSLESDKKMTVAIIKFSAYISRLPKQVLFVSQNSKLQHEALGYARENSYIIPNGFDTILFSPSLTERVDVRSELSLPHESLLIGLICRYHPMKDHANFIQAAALLLKEYPNTNFLMIGQGVDRDNPTLNKLIKELGIGDRISLLGERKDIPRLITSLDIFTSASAYGEAFPLVVGEAMSCGIPCVVTDVGDSGWIVGNTGKVIPPRNPQMLADAWKELIDLGDEGRNILGKAARARITEDFALNSVVAKYELVYEKILSNMSI
ncbi:MAG: glycosyltransferase [Nostoc sp. NMS1]|uniref:glycosyltransferase family 4 protein n=1 Tax=Nostoc sp. NMS1 TaxID=2815388 RepID=UPI0025F6E682|nr:glycosyltransferase [Nostoc sp. NMS1]MBN3907574.1 glycosyltransferase [Nostoc sp. NMS1]